MASSENSRGALFMALAMAAFTCNDAIVKSITSELGVAQIMAVRGVMATALIYCVARYLGVTLSLKMVMHPLVLLRTFFEIGATLTFLSALAHIEFAAASSIMQSLPLAVTLGAALFLGEPVGWRRWTAISVGFLGVLLIIRPGPEGFTPAALLAVAACFFTASRDLTTRRITADIPTLTVTLFTSFANTVVGVILIAPMGGWQPISTPTLGYLALASVLVFAGYQAVIKAMRVGEISFIAPFRYTGLLWALVIGIFLFGEHPNAYMLTGAAIVIGSGLYTFYRERKRRSPVAEKASVAPPV
ncbi:DMT family transporter [Neorhizobium petrolearium]|uniref:DMT family transporter n=1 Tax=Neorhizobium petrolearium TaxID=515361 RepID=A0ABY8M6N4_9HYPH|nr:DMT family transporter [Neorhizobium petrolearium]MCC2610009.1 DMT family transporter [Neorhizobium petrolearium]WGI70188.1 DMT family transporter [Neorhizobium petrolearium]